MQKRHYHSVSNSWYWSRSFRSENKEGSLTSDEDEVVLQEVVKEEFPEDLFEDQVKEEEQPIASAVAFPKPLMSKSHLKKCLSLRTCYHPKSTVTTTNIEASPTQWTESEETQIQRIIPMANAATSKSSTDTDSSFWERKTQLSVSGKYNYQLMGFYRKGRVLQIWS